MCFAIHIYMITGHIPEHGIAGSRMHTHSNVVAMATILDALCPASHALASHQETAKCPQETLMSFPSL